MERFFQLQGIENVLELSFHNPQEGHEYESVRTLIIENAVNRI